MTYREMEAAKRWGLSPDEWYEKPRWSRALMVAQVMVQKDLEYWSIEDSRDKPIAEIKADSRDRLNTLDNK